MKNSNFERSTSFVTKSETDKEKEKFFFRRVGPIDKSNIIILFLFLYQWKKHKYIVEFISFQ